MKSFFKVLIIFISLFIYNISFSQSNKARVVLGAGVPEYLHTGFGYEVSTKNLLTASFGILPSINKIWVLTLDYSLFLDQSKKFENAATWYVGQKISYQLSKSNTAKWQNVFLGLDLGRQFNVSKSIGINFESGIGYVLIDRSVYSDGGMDDSLKQSARFFPDLNLELFFRF